MQYELEPRYDSRRSFYGKAFVIQSPKKIELRSYSTIVAYIDLPQNKAVVTGWYSQTTGRHIKEFLKQYGFPAINKQQILNDYMEV